MIETVCNAIMAAALIVLMILMIVTCIADLTKAIFNRHDCKIKLLEAEQTIAELKDIIHRKGSGEDEI